MWGCFVGELMTSSSRPQLFPFRNKEATFAQLLTLLVLDILLSAL